MSKPILGIIGGGQLGSMLAMAAKKLKIKTIIFCDDSEAPAQKYSDEFVHGDYENKKKISEFVKKVDLITYEFENIPYETLNEINTNKPVLPKPSINKIIQHRLTEKNFINKLNIKTTQYILVKDKSTINSAKDLLPGLLKTTTLGYDGKGQYKINSISDIESLNINFSNELILEKLVKLKKEISIILTRFSSNKYEIYEPIENTHEEQILKYSKIPADISEINFI
jgi:5-(carboxyamino)imidazole ribonucleotide synthase